MFQKKPEKEILRRMVTRGCTYLCADEPINKQKFLLSVRLFAGDN